MPERRWPKTWTSRMQQYFKVLTLIESPSSHEDQSEHALILDISSPFARSLLS